MNAEHEEIIGEFTKIADSMHATTEAKLADFRTEVQRTIKERSARPPAAFGGNSETRVTPLLGGDQKFRDWLRGGRGRQSAYTASFSDFHIEKKVATVILSPSMPTHVPGIYGPPELALRLVELLPVVNLSRGGSVEFVQESEFTPGADIQVEGEVKPATSIDFTPATSSIKTIATIIKASTQALADMPELTDWLDARLRYSVQLKTEDYLLTAAAPDGLLASAGAVDPLFAPPTPNALDVIGGAIAQLQAGGYTVDGVVMAGSDVSQMRLLKNENGDYLWASPNSTLGTAAVWSVPLVISPSMTAGSFLVGAFAQSCILFSRQMLVVEIAYENEDDFIRNLACLRAEERVANAIVIPAGLVTGTFTPPAARTANKK